MPCRFYKTKLGMVHIRFARGAKMPPNCRECGDMAGFQCDYPVGKGKTCDRDLCSEHAIEVAPDTHYCPAHHAEWEKFSADGGVQRELANVVPYKTNKAKP